MHLSLLDPGLLRTQSYINGQWADAGSGATFEVNNPATGEVLARVADHGATQTVQAIEAAEAAMVSWRQRPAKERSQLLRGWFDLIMQNQEDLANIMTAEQGKVLAESRGEIAYAASFIEWFAEEPPRPRARPVPPRD